MIGRVPKSRVAAVLLMAAGLAAGCGDDNSSTPTGVDTSTTGVVQLVAPGGCGGAPCVGVALASVEISGPQPLSPFTMPFSVVNTLPFAPPGTYTIFGATFQDSGNNTQGCPNASYTVATARTTTVTFIINNDVCTVSVSGPA
jgi:hypothetical protein